MHRLKIIVNAAAGSARARDLARQAEREFWGWDLDVAFPRSVGETISECSALDANAYRAVILCGGDGTFNQALPSLLVKDIAVALFPAGTANDLAASLGIRADWRQLRYLIESNSTKQIDIVRANDCYFATVGGIGIGSLLIARVNELRASSASFSALWRRMKSKMYSLMTIRLILSGGIGLRHVRIESDKFSRSLNISSLQVANQGSFGAGLIVAPKAQNDDGVLDFVVLALNNRFELIRSMAETGLEQSFPANHRFTSDHCVVESLDGEAIPVYGDGEILFAAERIEFKVMPKALRVISANPGAGKREIK